MEYSKIEEREKASEKGSIAWQSGIVTIVRHGAFFCLIKRSAKQQKEGGQCGNGRILATIVGPPSATISVVGCYQNILACGGSSLTSAHQNVGTALSLKNKAGMSCQLTTGRKPGGSPQSSSGSRDGSSTDKPTDRTRQGSPSSRHESHGANRLLAQQD